MTDIKRVPGGDPTGRGGEFAPHKRDDSGQIADISVQDTETSTPSLREHFESPQEALEQFGPRDMAKLNRSLNDEGALYSEMALAIEQTPKPDKVSWDSVDEWALKARSKASENALVRNYITGAPQEVKTDNGVMTRGAHYDPEASRDDVAEAVARDLERAKKAGVLPEHFAPIVDVYGGEVRVRSEEFNGTLTERRAAMDVTSAVLGSHTAEIDGMDGSWRSVVTRIDLATPTGEQARIGRSESKPKSEVETQRRSTPERTAPLRSSTTSRYGGGMSHGEPHRRKMSTRELIRSWMASLKGLFTGR